MREPRWNPSAELYTVIAFVISVVAAGIATKIPGAAFGSFRHMTAILIASDVVLYLTLKLGLMKRHRAP